MNGKMILTKTEVRTIAGLSMQRNDLMAAMQEIAEAEHELIDVMVSRRGLPEGDYVIIQDEKGEIYLRQREEKKLEKAPGKVIKKPE